MKTIDLLRKAQRNGVSFECSCVGISANTWERLMKGATRADRRVAVEIAYMAGVIDAEQYRMEKKKPWYNPYNHYKTKTHLIYVHSSIEHFIRIL